MAVACSVAGAKGAIDGGVDAYINTTVNGIGERAGNADLISCLLAIKKSSGLEGRYHLDPSIDLTHSWRLAKYASYAFGVPIAVNQVGVGRNAFAHESGIHQAGLLSEAATFEIMKPSDVGLADSDLVLGKHSGRHALRARLQELGCELNDNELDEAFHRFKELADKKKEVTALDLEALVGEEIRERQDTFVMQSYVTQAGSGIIPTSQVEVDVRGRRKRGKSFSSGTVESVFKAIDNAVGMKGSLADYQVRAITAGKDSLAEVRVAVEVAGRSYHGQAVSYDVMEASAKAYVRALNNAAAKGE
jgi:2-isopropylmalate synthase